MQSIEAPGVAQVFGSYPDPVRSKLLILRQLVLETASQTEGVGPVKETLKWGEPSYLVKGGSTVRVSMFKGSPERYAMFFHCGTTLVETFRQLYPGLRFEGNRAIVLELEDVIPVDPLKHCISLALTYHSRKHLPMLGVLKDGPVSDVRLKI